MLSLSVELCRSRVLPYLHRERRATLHLAGDGPTRALCPVARLWPRACNANVVHGHVGCCDVVTCGGGRSRHRCSCGCHPRHRSSRRGPHTRGGAAANSHAWARDVGSGGSGNLILANGVARPAHACGQHVDGGSRGSHMSKEKQPFLQQLCQERSSIARWTLLLVARSVELTWGGDCHHPCPLDVQRCNVNQLNHGLELVYTMSTSFTLLLAGVHVVALLRDTVRSEAAMLLNEGSRGM